LNLASHLEFVVEGEELIGKLRAGFPEEDVAADAGFDHGRGERLVDVVDRSDFKAASFVFDAGLACEKDDGDFASRGIGLEASADLVAVHAGHHDVEKDEVGLFVGRRDSESLFPTGGDLGLVKILEGAGDNAEIESLQG
jgi:hypothetical protein